MIRKDFATKEEAIKYLETEKVLIEKKQSYLSASERRRVPELLKNPEQLVQKTIASKVKKIVTNIDELRIPCQEVSKDDNIKEIIQGLKDTLNAHPEGWGLTANQIGYNKRISFIKIPKKVIEKTQEIEYAEFVLINIKITERIGKSSLTIGEGCLSFPGVRVNTERYLVVMAEYLNEKLEKQTTIFQGNDALAVAHEADHQNGITIFDRKYKGK